MKKYYGCKKCGNRFKKPEKVIQYLDVGRRILNVCPLCKSRTIVEGYSNEK